MRARAPILETPADRMAQRAIRSLLNGTDAPEGITPALLGPWAETVQLLREAEATNGREGVRRAFVTMTHQMPVLIALLACDDGRPRKTRWSVRELYATDFPPPRMVVPGLLPAGLINLAGRPKIGKSWLAEQLAHAVGTGGTVLGLRAERGRVLYLALEDSGRRLLDRLHKQAVPEDADVTLVTEWPPLCAEGLSELAVEAMQGYALIIVDTLSRALGRADQMDMADMTLLMSNLQQIALRNDLALLLVDHHRKPGLSANGDPVDDIFGSTAKAGVIDAALGLYKGQNDGEAVLKVTGRDLCECEMALRWDADHFCWEAQGEATAVAHTRRQQELLVALEIFGKAQLRDLADATGQGRSNLFHSLQIMVQNKLVARSEEQGKVYYRAL